MTNKPAVWAVIPAAGKGKRMGKDVPKQYLSLGGKRLIDYSLEKLLAHDQIDGVVVALAADDTVWPEVVATMSEKFDKPLMTVEGGEQRCHSVFNALSYLSEKANENDWVMVHDAARPLVSPEDISRLIAVSLDGPVGAILAIPVTDTLKRENEEHRVAETVERAGLWRAVTPQMFRLGLLKDTLETQIREGNYVTDESAAMEAAGYQARLVESQPDNIKITHRADIKLAARLLS